MKPYSDIQVQAASNPIDIYRNTRSPDYTQYNYSKYDSTPQPYIYSAPETIQFFTETKPDGSYYEGEILGRLRHGKGKLVFKDGSCYEGEWKQGKIEGYGILYYSSGLIAYEGDWKNNRFEGKGAMYNEDQSLGELQMEMGSLSIDKRWLRYEGDFSNDKWHGVGKLFFMNGDEFEGEFKNDIIHGKGMYYMSNGRTVNGEWRNNRLIKQH